MKLVLFFFMLLPAVGWPLPKNVQVWFLKEAALKNLQTHIQDNSFRFYKLRAENNFECVPMGDGCFHPQLGYVEKESDSKMKEEPAPEPVKKNVDVKTFNSDEVQLVECDENNYFDIYCGKESGKTGWQADTEIWVDISSSLRIIDDTDGKGSCHRRVFVESLIRSCGGRNKLNVKIYNTTLKEVGAFDTLCLSYGTNNEDRLKDWIEASEATSLIILTDTSEITPSFSEYLETIRASTKGADTVDLFASDLMDHKKEILGFCK